MPLESWQHDIVTMAPLWTCSSPARAHSFSHSFNANQIESLYTFTSHRPSSSHFHYIPSPHSPLPTSKYAVFAREGLTMERSWPSRCLCHWQHQFVSETRSPNLHQSINQFLQQVIRDKCFTNFWLRLEMNLRCWVCFFIGISGCMMTKKSGLNRFSQTRRKKKRSRINMSSLCREWEDLHFILRGKVSNLP